jgi:outer membrane protein assembly factor BamB
MSLSIRFSFRAATVLLSCWLASPALIKAEDIWLNWRGMRLNGNASEGKYPLRWSEKDNIAWKVSLPGRGGSSPILVNNTLILTAGIDGNNALLAYDLNGKTLWERNLGAERPGKHKKGSGSNSSPTSDGQFIFAYFKSGDLACCKLSGEVVWQRNIQKEYGEDTLWWDLGTSPILANEAVIVAVMQSGPSFIVAFDKATGKQLWKVDRTLNVNDESNQAYTTPTLARTEQGEILLALGADHVTAHELSQGTELWRVGGFNPTNQKNYRSISSPLVAGDLVICPYARGQLVTAVRYQGGIAEKDRIAWQREKIGADVPTPTLVGDRTFFTTDKGDVNCVETSTGKTVWEGSLPKNRTGFSSSPVHAGGHLYLVREDGVTFVLKAGEKFQIVAENALEATTVATPIFATNKIYVRSFESLYCIANP